MLMNKLISFLLFLLYPFLFDNTSAQSPNADSAGDQSFKSVLDVFKKASPQSSHLYNGTEYVPYDHRIKGDPYFESSLFEPGSLVYDGYAFDSVPMFYDILNDVVVIKYYNKEEPVQLLNEKISRFSFISHNFIRLQSDNTNNIEAGFYDELYGGTSVKLFAKRRKKIEEKVTAEGTNSVFTEFDHYFILKEHNYHEVSSKNGVLDVFQDKKKEILKYLRQNNIDFKENPEYAMIKMAEYYEQIKYSR
jgi:hypothetical protein